MKKDKGFTLAEVMISSAILALIASTVIAASIMLKDVCYASITAHELQRSANLIMTYIVRRGPGETAYNGLQSAASFDLSDYNPAGSGISFTDLAAAERRYYAHDNSIVYESPTIPSGTRTVYTAPPGVSMFLEFAPSTAFLPVFVPGTTDKMVSRDGETVRITIELAQTVMGKRVAGSLVTYVNLMNVSR